jgi:hypothetical protein
LHRAASAIIIGGNNENSRKTGISRIVMRVLAIAAVAAAASLVAPAKAATITDYKVAGWNMAAFTDDRTGRFTHCTASARYKNGFLLLFSVNQAFLWSIGFSNPDWNLRQGRDSNVSFTIDGGRVHNVRGTAANTRLIRASLPDNVELFNQFRNGLRLVVNIDDNAPVTFNLTDTNQMLTEILRCAQKYNGYADRTGNNPRASDRDIAPRDDNRQQQTNRNNSGSGSSGSFRENYDDNRLARMPDREDDRRQPERQPNQTPNTPSLGPTPESRKEATDIATDILRRANFTFEFQKPEQLTGDLRDKYDAVWRADGVLGTLRILAGSRAISVDGIRGQLIADDANSCKGKFASGALPTTSGSQAQTTFTSCEAQNNWSVYYIAVPRRQGGIYLLGLAGTGEAAVRLQNVANAYRTVALEVLEK